MLNRKDRIPTVPFHINSRSTLYLEPSQANDLLPNLILVKCEYETPQGTPALSSSPEQRLILKNYIKALLIAVKPKSSGEGQEAFEARIDAANRQKMELAATFKSRFSREVACYRDHEPKVFFKIDEALKDIFKAQSILSKCHSEGSPVLFDLRSKPQIELLLRFIEASLNVLKRKEERESRQDFILRIRAEAEKQCKLAKEFQETFSTVLPCENGCPQIIFKITEIISAIEQTKMQQIQTMFPMLSPDQLQAISYELFAKMDKTAQQFSQTLDILRAHFVNDAIQFSVELRKTSFPSLLKKKIGFYTGWSKTNPSDLYFNESLRYIETRLNATNQASGRYVFSLLQDISIIDPKAVFENKPNTSFKLNYKQLTDLISYLEESQLIAVNANKGYLELGYR